MAIINNILKFGASDNISSLANYAQLVDISLQITDLSNTQLLKKILPEFEHQNKNLLEIIIKYCERILIENSSKIKLDKQLLENQNIIIEQNKQIISLLQGGK